MAFTLVDLSILLISIALVIYFLGKKQRSRFTNTKTKFLKPYILIGNAAKVFLGYEHLNDTVNRTYRAFPNDKYVGFFSIANQSIIIKDLEILKQVTVKEFDHFVDHYTPTDPDIDPLFFHNLFSLKGDKWRDMRNTLSPTFTGSKMKAMVPFLEQCAERLVDYVSKQIDSKTNQGQQYYELELKDLFTRYTNDVIASCAFGIESDSLNDQDNTFYKMSEDLTGMKALPFIKFAGIVLFPRIMKFLNISMMPKKLANFFRSIVAEIMESREKSGVVRKDMIHLLMQAIKGSINEETDTTASTDDVGFATVYEDTSERRVTKRTWTQDEITAQVVIFLFAGFDTTSTLLSFMAYELTMCPEALKKLQEEIDEYVKEHDGDMVTYNDLHKLKYLDMVCSESLRLWSPAGVMDRVCTKPYTLPPSYDGHPGIQLRKGDIITLPIMAIHTDPTYWKNPEKFIPERFSDENKDSIHPFSFIPFGVGPRSCIGNRFALLEIKLLAFYMLRHFDLIATPKSDYPLKITSHVFRLSPVNGFWIGLKKRNIVQ